MASQLFARVLNRLGWFPVKRDSTRHLPRPGLGGSMLKSFKYTAAALAAAAIFSVAGAASAQFVVPEVHVSIAPPPPRVEVRTIQPSSNHIWINGHWAWRYGQHTWIQGHWAEPPNQGMIYEPARWTSNGAGYSFVEGHWRWANPPQTVIYQPPAPVQPVYIQTQPPPIINEVRAPIPYGGAVWIPGYWHWNGYNHVWVGGHYSAPRVGYRWEPDHWVQGPTGWYRVGGRWVQ